ncbi:MAG: TonB-dependent receptor [Alphaproteobacteria bacterium]|nr:MAG: TonB-dependent receptor [Alphaproteobacteria bacterium]
MRIAKNALCLSSALMGTLALQSAAQAADEAVKEVQFEEIIVTANKRSENLRTVAGAVSAMTGDQLSELGADSLSDYITRLPGVHFNDYQPGVSEVVIRGVSATTYHEQGQTTVGYYINEVPLNEAGWPIVIPDIDTFDLERVEVLRGPQGSLYGASALGGLVNYIAREADTDGYDGAFEASLGHTKGAGDPSYSVKGMANVPLVKDKLAVRVVGLERKEAGYLDNEGTGEDDVNNLSVRGFRGSVVFKPSEGTKLSWMSMYQETNLDDATYVTVPTLVRNTFVPEPHETKMWLHSLRLDQDLEFADLTVLGAIANKDSVIVFDYSSSGYLQGTPTWSDGFGEADSKHIEARLSSKDDGPFSWLVGAAYYESTKYSNDAVYQEGAADFIDANPGDFGGNSGAALAPGDYFSQYVVDQENKDWAIFGEVSYDITDQLNLTAGGRYFDSKSDTAVTIPPSASFLGVYDAVGTQFGALSAETGFTPKVTLKYQATEDFMVYARYSEGFRVGGANPNAGRLDGVSPAYDPDSITNYEVGTRVDLLDKSLLLDLTAFHIKWTDMQVRLFTPAPYYYSYLTNAGAAKIDGLEFSLSWRPTDVLDLHSNITYLDARVSTFVPDTFAAGGGHEPGTTLPGSSKWTIANSATLHFDDVTMQPSLMVSHKYLSEAPVAFNSVTQRGGYHLVDVRGTLKVAENVELAVYVENLFDKYGILSSPFGDYYLPNPLGSVTRPRSVGMKFSWTFQ